MGIDGCWQADSQRLLNEVMVEHFFRQGMLDVAEELCQVLGRNLGDWSRNRAGGVWLSESALAQLAGGLAVIPSAAETVTRPPTNRSRGGERKKEKRKREGRRKFELFTEWREPSTNRFLVF